MESFLIFLIENAKWVFSGVGIPIVAYLFFNRNSSHNITVKVDSKSSNKVNDEVDKTTYEPRNNPVISEDSYRVKVGKKHKWLRENILQLTIREMANFYGLEEVSKVESYESGNIELPIKLVEKLENFFFINSDVIDGESPYIFKSFHLSQPSIHELFEQGFSPKIACCPYDRGDLLCFVVMHKVESGFTRIVSSDLIGSFKSSGGGRMNIQYLIEELIIRNIPDYEVSILKTTEGDWKKLERNCYYDVGLFHRLGAADQECINIFSRWYSETLKLRDIDNHKVS